MRNAAAESMFTAKNVPPFPLEWKCKTCQLAQSHPEVFEELTLRMLRAEPRKGLVTWLAKQGIKRSLPGLCVHYRRHVLPYWREAVEVQQRLQIQAEALGQQDAGSIASALAMSLAMKAMDAVHAIDFARLGRTADSKLIDALTRLSEANAKIVAYQADARLKEELIKLRTLELIRKGGDLDEIAVRLIESALREHPDLARQVRDALKADKAKALPAPTEPNAPNRTRKTSSRRSRSRAR